MIPKGTLPLSSESNDSMDASIFDILPGCRLYPFFERATRESIYAAVRMAPLIRLSNKIDLLLPCLSDT